MSTIADAESEKLTKTEGQLGRRGMGLPSLKIVSGSLLIVALVMALGMTGGQVRELAGRVNALETDREDFIRRVDKLRGDNQQLIGKLRDYQQVLEVAQASNVSLSKRLQNREMAVNDLQDSLDSILKEKYATENKLRGQVAQLENLKRDLSAQVAALGEAVAAQGQEIAQLDSAYQSAERQLAQTTDRNSQLLSENDRYLTMLSQMQDDLEAMQEEGEVMAERFVTLQTRSQIIEAEKRAIQEELEVMKSISVEAFSADQLQADPFSGQDPFEFDTHIPAETEGLFRTEGEVLASAEENPA